MLKNYFKIAWRNITRQKFYTAINILGLSLGLCACIVIYTIIHYELSFDGFHPGKERIYRVIGNITESWGVQSSFAALPAPLPQTARAEITGFDAIAGIVLYNSTISIPDGNNSPKTFTSRSDGLSYSSTVIAEQPYFDIFQYDWRAGNPATALRDPFTVVLTERKARQYFGSGSLDKMIGKEVIYDDSLHVHVSGIVKDWEQNTDLAFTDFISFPTIQSSFLKNNISPDSWKHEDISTRVFAKLSKGVSPVQVDAQMVELVKRHAGSQIKLTPWLEPLSDLHFNAQIIENPIRTAHMPTLYGLMGVALFIILLAIINFINLSTAQSIRRAKEVGIRKVMGGSRTSLVFQFLTETLLLTCFSVLLGVLFVGPVLTAFQSFIPAGARFHFFAPSTLLFLSAVTLITSLLAGLYPARVLSSYLPVLTLKGLSAAPGTGEKWLLRKGLIIFQFSISLIFIISSLVIASQLDYARKKDMGFTADAIVTIETPRGDSLAKARLVAEKIRQLSGVSGVAMEWATPGDAKSMNIKLKSRNEKETRVAQVDGDENLIPLYQLKLLAGSNLQHSDSVNEFVINEKLSRLMDYKKPEDAIGKTLYWNDKPYPITGVVADFNSSSLHNPIVPLCIINRVEREGTLGVKLNAKGKQSGDIKAVLAQIEKLWKSVYPDGVFDYQFYDELLARKYEKDQQTATLTNTAMSITIFISCIGLFGLTLFTAEKRSREIGIRKILGAGIMDITSMLCKDFVLLVIIALFVASPIAWYFMNRWLHGFAYHVRISGWIFVSAGAAAIFIALVTVSSQAIRAALADPVKNLRTE